ncbi:MAG: BPSS1187 family protein, partial [Mycobacteriales bacterium]
MRRTRLAALSAVLLAAVLGLPGARASLTAPTGVRTVTPSATDPAIGLPNAAHHVVVPSGTPKGLLFVFLPGSGASPLGYDDVVLEAGAQGYHAVGLSYPNATTAATKCGNDLGCYGPLHQKVFDGTGTSTVDTTTPVNAVEHRLTALLTYLDASYPTEGWGQYVAGGLPVWSKVVLSGHSQGASEAAWGG